MRELRKVATSVTSLSISRLSGNTTGNRVATTGHLTARQAELGRPDGQGGLTTIWFALWRFTIIQRRKFSEQVPRMAKRKARILNREICEPREQNGETGFSFSFFAYFAWFAVKRSFAGRVFRSGRLVAQPGHGTHKTRISPSTVEQQRRMPTANHPNHANKNEGRNLKKF